MSKRWIIFFILIIVSLCSYNSYAYEVSGEIIYEGGELGVYVVALYETLGLPEHVTFTLWPGEYSISGVDSGSYFVMGYKDENANFVPDLGEPLGFYGEAFPPILEVSDDVDSVNIELDDTGATISGEVEAEDGNETGQFIVLPLWNDTLSWVFMAGFPHVEEETEYGVSVFSDGEYYIGGWRDSNLNWYLDESEPFGFYGGTDPFLITIEDMEDIEDIDFILYYPEETSVDEESWGDIKRKLGEE
jgi:hypothetical protein